MEQETRRYDYDNFDVNSFRKYQETSEEWKPAREKLRKMLIRNRNQEIEEETLDIFIHKGIKISKNALKKMHDYLYHLKKITGRSYELKYELVSDDEDVVIDAHPSFDQIVSGNSVYHGITRDRAMEELISFLMQKPFCIAHSHGSFEIFHSEMDDDMISELLRLRGKNKEIKYSGGFKQDIRYLASVVINESPQRPYSTFCIELPKLTGTGEVKKEYLFTGNVPLELVEHDYVPESREEIIAAEIMDRVMFDISTGPGKIPEQRSLAYIISRNTGLSEKHLTSPLTEYPDFREISKRKEQKENKQLFYEKFKGTKGKETIENVDMGVSLEEEIRREEHPELRKDKIQDHKKEGFLHKIKRWFSYEDKSFIR